MCVKKLPEKVRRILAAKKAWRSRKSTSAARRHTTEEHFYPNGAPMFAKDGMMLDDQGNRSIFDDVDE